MKQLLDVCQMEQKTHGETKTCLQEDLYVIPKQLIYDIFTSLLEAT